jgi:biotin transporter BioY
MYIIAIGWIWVAFMMAITERSIVAGLMTFVFYGLLPCGLLLYIMGTPARRRRRERELAAPAADAAIPKSDVQERSENQPG